MSTTPMQITTPEPWINDFYKSHVRHLLVNCLKELETQIESYSEKQKEAIRKETAYLENNRHRMDYKTGADLGQPLGSGAIESTCSQYQRRFKMTGQFWSLEGDEAFLALSTLHRNGRWNKLFPASRVP